MENEMGKRPEDSHPHFLACAEFLKGSLDGAIDDHQKRLYSDSSKPSPQKMMLIVKSVRQQKIFDGTSLQVPRRFPADAETEATSSLPTDSEERGRNVPFSSPANDFNAN